MKLAMIGDRGHVGYVYHSLPHLPDLAVAGLCATGSDSAKPMEERVAALGHKPAIYADWRRMLHELRPDFVCVGGPFELHGPMCIESLRLGAHVFCEKPVVMNLAELREIEAILAEHRELRLQGLLGMRYDPTYLAAHAAVRKSEIGKVRLINARKSYKLGERPDYYKSRSTYCGTIPWVGSHMVDLIYCFAGAGFASAWASHTSEGNFNHGDLEIAAQCQFVMANGVLADCSLDFLRPQAAPTHADNRLRIVGSEGVVEVDNEQVTLTNASGVRKLPLGEEVRIFEAFVRNHTPPGVAALDNTATIEVARACLLAQESARTGQVVREFA
jgi:predicted dehydrogenase